MIFLVKEIFTMITLNIMHETETMNTNGGTKRYFCPWNDYSNTSYWKTYGHAISCAYKRGLFNLPIAMIKAAIKLR